MPSRRAAERRSPSRLHPSLLALAAVAACGGVQAQAQPGTETITVTGIRAALESALNAKRQDNGIVDVVKAEDIAKFPDTNLAESLQRIPGVVIDRDAGEGRSITVRGLGQDFTRVRINGIEALATTGGTDSSGGNNRGRGFDFNVFASELFSSLTVRKSSSADVEEGSLGATVDLQTSRPFDFKEAVLTASVQGRYNDLAKTTTPRMSVLLSNTFADRKLGVLFSAAYAKRKVYEEGFSTVRWDTGASSGGWCAPTGTTANPSTSTATTCGPAAQNVPRLDGVANPGYIAEYTEASSVDNYHPRLPRYGRLTHEQDRLGVTSAVQWRPQEGSLLTLDLMYAKLKATREEDFLEAISFSRTATQGGKPQTSVIETQYAPNGALLYGKFNGVDIRSESRFDRLETTFTQPTLTYEQELNDSLRLTARIGRAESKFRNPVQTTVTLDALNTNGYEIDFRGDDRLPRISYPFDVTQAGGALGIVGVPAGGTSIANTTSSEIRIRPQGSTNTNDSLSLALDWEAAPGALNVKAGFDRKRYRFSTYEFRRTNQSETIYGPPAGTSSASLSTMMTGFGNGLSLPGGVPTAWVMPDLQAIASAYDIYCNCLKSGPAGGPGDFTLTSINNGNARGNNRSVVETDTGLWLMGEFSARPWGVPLRGNVGTRIVSTQQSATGYQSTGSGTEVTVDNDYTDFLPSFNLAATLAPDFIARFSAAKVMARPQLGNLNPGGTLNSTGKTLSIGNPKLQPFRAWTADLNGEWYFDRNAFVGVGYFAKKIGTYIQSLRQRIPYAQTGLPLFSGIAPEDIFEVTQPVNSPGGWLRGLEINYQQPFTFLPGIGKNFGVVTNYTYVKSKINYLVSPTSSATVTDDLLNLSPRSLNLTLYYDDGSFSARVSGTKRSTYLTRVPGQNSNDVEGKNGSTNVDLSVSYQWNKNLAFTFEGVNLTNEANDQFTSRARNSPVVYHVTGREFLLGARYKF